MSGSYGLVGRQDASIGVFSSKARLNNTICYLVYLHFIYFCFVEKQNLFLFSSPSKYSSTSSSAIGRTSAYGAAAKSSFTGSSGNFFYL